MSNTHLPDNELSTSQHLHAASAWTGLDASQLHNSFASKTWLRQTCQTTMKILCWLLLLGTFIPSANAIATEAGIVFDDTPLNFLDTREVMYNAIQQRDDSTNTLPTATATTASAALVTASSTSTSLPRPFDTSLGNNFTQMSCPMFFNSFLSSSAFQQCMPFSLLLQTSNAFFAASRSLVQLTQTLDATCHANFNSCTTLMNGLATQIKLNSNCGQDLQLQNPLVQQAYDGLASYSILYQAACLKDDSGNYCYADAVQNASAPSSYYTYYLPLGVQLPSDSNAGGVACTKCLQNTMAVFANQASNSSALISNTYPNAAKIIDGTCGSNFVDASVRSAASTTIPTLIPSVALLMMLWFAI